MFFYCNQIAGASEHWKSSCDFYYLIYFYLRPLITSLHKVHRQVRLHHFAHYTTQTLPLTSLI